MDGRQIKFVYVFFVFYFRFEIKNFLQNLGNLSAPIVSFGYEVDYPGLNKKLLINNWEEMDIVEYDILVLKNIIGK